MEAFSHAVQSGCYGLLIDDSGSPGAQPNNPNLPKAMKTWICVVVPPAAMRVIEQQLPPLVQSIKNKYGASELHFVDIYGGRRCWKQVPSAERLAICKFMAWVFETYDLKLLVQSFSDEQHRDVLSRMSLPRSPKPFDMDSAEDAALLFLLIRAKWHLQELHARAGVFVDAGNKWKAAGSRHKVNIFSDVFLSGEFGFYDSAQMMPIQIADFAAFFHNRANNMGRQLAPPSAFDRELIEILQPLQRAYLNIRAVDWDEWFKNR